MGMTGMRKRHHLQRFFPRPGHPVMRGELRPTTLGLVVVVAMAIGFGLGRWLPSAADEGQAQAVASAKADFNRRLKAAEERAAVKEREYAIIENASTRLQDDNQELLAGMAALEDRVAFFKRMAAPQAARSTGAAIDLFELRPSGTAGKVRYRLLVMRNNPNGKPAPAAVRVLLSGGGHQQELHLQAPRFQLRYYQQFSGEWAVPAGFTPERVDIQVQSGGVSVDRRFKWEIKSR